MPIFLSPRISLIDIPYSLFVVALFTCLFVLLQEVEVGLTMSNSINKALLNSLNRQNLACLNLRQAVSKTVWTNLGLNGGFVVRCNVQNS